MVVLKELAQVLGLFRGGAARPAPEANDRLTAPLLDLARRTSYPAPQGEELQALGRDSHQARRSGRRAGGPARGHRLEDRARRLIRNESMERTARWRRQPAIRIEGARPPGQQPGRRDRPRAACDRLRGRRPLLPRPVHRRGGGHPHSRIEDHRRAAVASSPGRVRGPRRLSSLGPGAWSRFIAMCDIPGRPS